VMVQLASSVGALQRLAQQGELTQVAVDEILSTLKRLPTEQRQTVVGFLNNLAASATFNAILTAIHVLSR